MSDQLLAVLFDTFCWTGGLIIAVLALRRPVARWFGPRAAYMLWLLPMARLMLPPLVLPHEWAPAAAATEDFAQIAPAVPAAIVDATPVTAAGAISAEPIVASVAGGTWGVDLTLVTLGAWLAGTALFLFGRYRGYFIMRRELLREARCVGRAGRIRMVETPFTRAPLAFGVIDPVIALPTGFMAQPDRTARDFALEHELAHHRGHDVLINFLVQPLFAIHWFNPLAHIGWRALRRDQEAACDARVVQTSAPSERAAYAGVIASFAAGPDLGLAAPMACPVLGDKSIIHRLRSLAMSDRSPRRRHAGVALTGVALLALPLTATISYAEPATPASIPDLPVPAAPLALLAPPPPPTAADLAMPPLPPLPSMPPMPTLPPEAFALADLDAEARSADLAEEHGLSASDRAEMQEAMAQAMIEMREALAEAETVRREALAEAMVTQREAMAEAMAAQHEAIAEARAAGVEASAIARAIPRISVVEGRCADRDATTVEQVRGDRQIITICKANIAAQAVAGLIEARRSIAQDHGLSKDVREEILRSLDREIARFKDRNG